MVSKEIEFDGDFLAIGQSEKYQISNCKDSAVLIIAEDTNTDNLMIGSQRTTKGFPLRPGESIVIRSMNDVIPISAPEGNQFRYLIVNGDNAEIEV